LITYLDPGSCVLKDNYQAIMDKFLNLHLGEYGIEQLHRESNVISTEEFRSADDFAKFAGRRVP
jgi:hypothetical protein